MNHQLVTGAGPVGATVALALADAGHHVRLLTRSGSGPDHPLIERRRADVNDRTALDAALEGAGPGSAVFHCIHGSAYDAQVWRRELPAAERVVLAAAGDHDLPAIFPRACTPTATPTAGR
ncbi:NAD-dependent epimerase/dehydratase family protein [Aestuariimicrobium soli]|uniref:NAD-dependent epimerase/dehydratase family protein n=1 Tax=Aestuariimicrobium soli TaxID=2035834 RepID=UPI003EBA0D59